MPASAPAKAGGEPPVQALLRIPLSSDAVSVASTALPPVDAFEFVFGRTEPLRPGSGGEAAVMVVLNPAAHPAAQQYAQEKAAMEAERYELDAQRRAALAAREETDAQRRAALQAKKAKAGAAAAPATAMTSLKAQLSADRAEREASRQRYNAELRAWRSGDRTVAERVAAREAERDAWLPLLYDAADAAAADSSKDSSIHDKELERWRSRTAAPGFKRPEAEPPQPHGRALRGPDSVVAQRRAMETLKRVGKKNQFLGEHPDPCGWERSLENKWPTLPLFPPHLLVGAETLPDAEAQQNVSLARLSGRYFTGF